MHLLNPEIPLESAESMSPPKRRTAIQVERQVLARYVGRYSFSTGDTLTVTLEGDRLFEQRTGELEAEIYPESARGFFCKVFDEQVMFSADSRGLTTRLIYTQIGGHILSSREHLDHTPAE